MVRKMILAVVILAMAAVPVPALARDGGHGGGHGFRGGHERFEHHGRFEHFHRPFYGFYYPYPYYPYPYYGAPHYPPPYYPPPR
jgi:hypothetical protein